MKKTIETIIVYAIVSGALIGMIYGGYWAAKTTSYTLFYEDMVIDTIQETVKPEALK